MWWGNDWIQLLLSAAAAVGCLAILIYHPRLDTKMRRLGWLLVLMNTLMVFLQLVEIATRYEGAL